MKKKLLLIITVFTCLLNLNAQLEGTTQPITFTGPVTGNPITFTIYLPPNYDVNTSKEYPVVYHLHGVNGTHDGNQINTVPGAFEAAKDSGDWDEAIIVFPDGYLNSMWTDSYDDAKPAETNVIEEIIPYVDNNYRTIADKEHRLMQGFSMGGFGALKFYARYPELFCKVVVYDGALHNWSTLTSQKPDIATEIFNDDSTLFNTQASPWKFLEQNASSFTHDTLIYIAVGALKQYNEPMSAHLDALGIPHIYVETGCPHAVGCMLDEEGQNAAIFHSECLNAAPKYNVTVTNGTGSGEYEEGATVNIVADAAPTGKGFDQWTGDVSLLTSATATATSFTMPDSAIELTATYIDIVNAIEESSNNIYVYPNPTRNKFTISSPQIIESIQLISIVGEIVMVEQSNQNSHKIDISHLRNGLYFIKILRNNESAYFIRLVKE